MKGNFVFLRFLTTKIIIELDKLSALESLKVQIEKFGSSKGFVKLHDNSKSLSEVKLPIN
jgi:hypothetical protein